MDNLAPRIHRTMQEAFGPYTSDTLYPMPDPLRVRINLCDVLLAVAIGLAFAVLLVCQLSK